MGTQIRSTGVRLRSMGAQDQKSHPTLRDYCTCDDIFLIVNLIKRLAKITTNSFTKLHQSILIISPHEQHTVAYVSP